LNLRVILLSNFRLFPPLWNLLLDDSKFVALDLLQKLV
jgi:hypothetical protein